MQPYGLGLAIYSKIEISQQVFIIKYEYDETCKFEEPVGVKFQLDPLTKGQKKQAHNTSIYMFMCCCGTLPLNNQSKRSPEPEKPPTTSFYFFRKIDIDSNLY